MNRDDRVSLHGLSPEEALRALLAVNPQEPVEGEEHAGEAPAHATDADRNDEAPAD